MKELERIIKELREEHNKLDFSRKDVPCFDTFLAKAIEKYIYLNYKEMDDFDKRIRRDMQK